MATTRRKPSSASNVTPLRPDLAAQRAEEAKGKTGRRSFGRIDQLPSGMFRARYPDPDNPHRRIAADTTFQTKT
ncbi:MAG: hypothetical protein LCH76_01190, partial [Actinobacteria bacterium]|nr:hypothetical protein [Actinomycetota bacterium]